MKKTRTILFYNTMFGEPLDIPREIPENYSITANRRLFNDADVVVFHIPDLKAMPIEPKRKGQVWVAWSKESDINYRCLKRPCFMRLFDFKMTYHLDSDIPDTYLPENIEDFYKSSPVEKEYLINAFISSPFNQSMRLQYLQELMKYMEVHSYGKVFNNMAVRNDMGSKSKTELIKKYKFTIAFENSIAKDYVTEKFFQPLLAGSVPVYLGAPNVDDFAPGKNCYINVNDFDSPKSLASYLKTLDRNLELYKQYFEWKEQPLNTSFHRISTDIWMHPMVRLCKKLNQLY